jgi:hypothetical protein
MKLECLEIQAHIYSPHFTPSMLLTIQHPANLCYSIGNRSSDTSSVNWLHSIGYMFLLTSIDTNPILPTWSSIGICSTVPPLCRPGDDFRLTRLSHRRVYSHAVASISKQTQDSRRVADEKTISEDSYLAGARIHTRWHQQHQDADVVVLSVRGLLAKQAITLVRACTHLRISSSGIGS